MILVQRGGDLGVFSNPAIIEDQLAGGNRGLATARTSRGEDYAVIVSPEIMPFKSNGANGFPVRRFPVRFASRAMGPTEGLDLKPLFSWFHADGLTLDRILVASAPRPSLSARPRPQLPGDLRPVLDHLDFHAPSYREAATDPDPRRRGYRSEVKGGMPPSRCAQQGRIPRRVSYHGCNIVQVERHAACSAARPARVRNPEERVIVELGGWCCDKDVRRAHGTVACDRRGTGLLHVRVREPANDATPASCSRAQFLGSRLVWR